MWVLALKELACLLRVLVDNFVDQTVLLSLLGRHDVVALRVLLDFIDGLLVVLPVQ